MGALGVVTDSAADIPAAIAAARGVRVVPLTITFGDESFLDGVELPSDAFWDKLRTGKATPATAAPGPGNFEETYKELLDGGASSIVSVHLSSKLSATYESAVLASRSFPEGTVRVFDSLGVSAATALLALHAVDEGEKGTAPDAIMSQLAEVRSRMHLYATVDTLEYLRRGGRIGGAQALLGTMLQVKPVISLGDGLVEPSGRVRTRHKALQHLAGLVQQRAGDIERLIVVHGQATDIDAFLDMVRPSVDVPAGNVWAFGPVVGTHTGPGVIGVVFVTGR